MISLGTTELNRPVASPALTTNRQICWSVALALPLLVGPLWCMALYSEGSRLGTLGGFVLLAVLGASAVTDIRGHKIYNWATYSAFLWALVINATATMLSTSSDGPTFGLGPAPFVGPAVLGGVGLPLCLAGAAICFGITMFGYDLSGGGAGDVKLAAVVGSLLGLQGIFAVAYSYMVAAVAIMAWTIWTNGPLALLKAAGRRIGAFFGPLWPFPPTAADETLLMKPIPLGPYFAIGTLLVVLEIVPS